MAKKLHYTLCTLVLTLGLMALLHGSRLILETYQRESLYIEVVMIGAFPDEKKIEIFKKRGLKDGIIHLLYQVTGASVALAACHFLLKKT
jgi:hypothetical protein